MFLTHNPFFLSMVRGVSKNYRNRKNSPEMNDSEVDPVARKKLDEKYYFFVEKSELQNCNNKKTVCPDLSQNPWTVCKIKQQLGTIKEIIATC